MIQVSCLTTINFTLIFCSKPPFLLIKHHLSFLGASLVAQMVKESACNAGDPGSISGQEDPLEKEMGTHSSILVRKTP